MLSTLWIFVTLNYLYADVVSLMDKELLSQYLTGTVEGLQMTQGFFVRSRRIDGDSYSYGFSVPDTNL